MSAYLCLCKCVCKYDGKNLCIGLCVKVMGSDGYSLNISEQLSADDSEMKRFDFALNTRDRFCPALKRFA